MDAKNETHFQDGQSGDARAPDGIEPKRGWLSWLVSQYHFTSLTRRIAVLNLVALVVLVSGIMLLNQFRAGLIDAKVQSLQTQGEIIAGAIAASATLDAGAITIDPERLLELEAGESISPAEEELSALEFPINPEKVAPVLRRLISPTQTRARIYGGDGALILDSRHIYSRGQVLRFDLPPTEEEEPGTFKQMWRDLKTWFRRRDLPLYKEIGADNGKAYPEVASALTGTTVSIVRVTEKGEMVVSVAVPVQRFRAVMGALLLSTQGGDIDAIISAERWAIARVFLVAVAVTVLLSIILAGTIAGPVRRLSKAADRVRLRITARQTIPDFTNRRDEIGHLSGALRDMTNALYNRIDAIESFAADVAHEIKNPLTSLKSAVETLPLAKTAAQRAKLIQIVQDDVKRLDRLISDISDASRLDAELSRDEAGPVDMAALLQAVVEMAGDRRGEGGPEISLHIEDAPRIESYVVQGHDSRLGQVVNNLIDNALSFSPPGGAVRVNTRRLENAIEITVEDDGPGIAPDNLDRIFRRFYTDRPGAEAFGKNSGLGLSISQQIVEAHGGTIRAENLAGETEDDSVTGARFVVRLPANGK